MRAKRQTLDQIIERHLRALIQDLALNRKTHPKALWKVNDEWAIRQRTGFLRDALLSHFRQYASRPDGR